MARKENLLIEIYHLKNRIAAVNGDVQIDVDQYRQSPRFYRELKESKEYKLKERLENLTKSYERAIEEKRMIDVREAYYATPEGAAHKSRMEEAIEKKITEWKDLNRRTAERIESRIRRIMGAHWGVKRFDKGYLCIGVIDAGQTTPKQREFFFGQEIEIRYEWNSIYSKRERFECNCGTCGSFAMSGGATVGERAMFYVGLGALYSDAETVEWLRTTMRDHSRTLSRIREELDSLHAELNNPTTTKEAQ